MSCVLLRIVFEMFIYNSCNVTVNMRNIHLCTSMYVCCTSYRHTYMCALQLHVQICRNTCTIYICKSCDLQLIPLLHQPLPLACPPLRRKCEWYWEPALNEPFKPGRDLSVTILRCDTHPEFELRTIKVEKVGGIWTLVLTELLHLQATTSYSPGGGKF